MLLQLRDLSIGAVAVVVGAPFVMAAVGTAGIAAVVVVGIAAATVWLEDHRKVLQSACH